MTRPFETWPIAISQFFPFRLQKSQVVLLQPINRTASARSGPAADPSSLELSPPARHTHNTGAATVQLSSQGASVRRPHLVAQGQ